MEGELEKDLTSFGKGFTVIEQVPNRCYLIVADLLLPVCALSARCSHLWPQKMHILAPDRCPDMLTLHLPTFNPLKQLSAFWPPCQASMAAPKGCCHTL